VVEEIPVGDFAVQDPRPKVEEQCAVPADRPVERIGGENYPEAERTAQTNAEQIQEVCPAEDPGA
jgi:hypothetical protein